MSGWHMVTIVGADRAGIVARVTRALYDGGCNLGEVSAMRLGGHFTIMMIVAGPRIAGDDPPATAQQLDAMLRPVATELTLTIHVQPLSGRVHEDLAPDVRISVFGADRPGIVAEATAAFARAGLNIVHLESEVGGRPDELLYVMQIEGQATHGLEALRAALGEIRHGGVEATLEPIETLVG
jgi:glycine cleavage system transcriptional repressor